MSPRQLLGGQTPRQFLQRHWQKKPLLVRQAFPGFQDPLSPNELAGLAMEAGVKSRLVMERGGSTPWHLTHGPLSERRLRTLPKSHWSLLVSDVNQYSDAAAALLDSFSFIPHWRMDDLMVSFAPPQGSVGPHVDSYDVFLIQGKGRRRWQIADAGKGEMKPGLPLKILKNFKAAEEWVLEPGDMLYLPPGVAHYGVALEECLTYSVGFRAPDASALWRDFFNLPEELLGRLPPLGLYSDPELQAATHPGEIGAPAIKALEAMLSVPLRRDVVGRWFGAWTTLPPQGAEPVKRPKRPAPKALEKSLRARQSVLRTDLLRVAYVRLEDEVAFFAGGEEWLLPPACLTLAQAVCEKRQLDPAVLLKALPKSGAKRTEALSFLADLVERRVLDLGKTQAVRRR